MLSCRYEQDRLDREERLRKQREEMKRRMQERMARRKRSQKTRDSGQPFRPESFRDIDDEMYVVIRFVC